LTEETSVNAARVAKLCQEMADSRRVVVASNRGPVQYRLSEDGELSVTRGGGGVAIALSALSRYLDFTWVASTMGEGDRCAAETAEHGTLVTSLDGQRFCLRFVYMPNATYDKYYSTFCNRFLWFFQHDMWVPSYNPGIDEELRNAWEDGYIPANQAFAEAVLAEAEGKDSPLIMLHDYHLYLTPEFIRSRLPHALIQHFIHIPWPAASQWMLLPRSLSKSICRSLCSCDIVGLQTMRDVHNFLLTCQFNLEEAWVDHQNCVIQLNGHQTKVNAYPISVDVATLQGLAGSRAVKEYEERLRPLLAEKTIVRVDRLDPTKNILSGFYAYDVLLSRHPHLVGEVDFLAFLVPSRTNLKEYQEYARKVFQAIDEINSKYGRGDWQPIKMFYEHNYSQALAGMRLYDVLLVNSVADGMNLVAKEGPSVNTKDGVLILSQEAGAHEQLKDAVIPIVPTDIEGTVQALYEALTMPVEEKKRRAERLREKIREEDITHWFWAQLKGLHALADGRLALTK
jgi:trehalose 6-phosphate synthase